MGLSQQAPRGQSGPPQCCLHRWRPYRVSCYLLLGFEARGAAFLSLMPLRQLVPDVHAGGGACLLCPSLCSRSTAVRDVVYLYMGTHKIWDRICGVRLAHIASRTRGGQPQRFQDSQTTPQTSCNVSDRRQHPNRPPLHILHHRTLRRRAKPQTTAVRSALASAAATSPLALRKPPRNGIVILVV